MKSKELTEVARKEIEVRSREGKTVREIAQQLGMPKSTVQDTLGRVKMHGVLKGLPRSGQKRKTTPRIDQKIPIRVENSETKCNRYWETTQRNRVSQYKCKSCQH